MVPYVGMLGFSAASCSTCCWTWCRRFFARSPLQSQSSKCQWLHWSALTAQHLMLGSMTAAGTYPTQDFLYLDVLLPEQHGFQHLSMLPQDVHARLYGSYTE